MTHIYVTFKSRIVKFKLQRGYAYRNVTLYQATWLLALPVTPATGWRESMMLVHSRTTLHRIVSCTEELLAAYRRCWSRRGAAQLQAPSISLSLRGRSLPLHSGVLSFTAICTRSPASCSTSTFSNISVHMHFLRKKWITKKIDDILSEEDKISGILIIFLSRFFVLINSKVIGYCLLLSEFYRA